MSTRLKPEAEVLKEFSVPDAQEKPTPASQTQPRAEPSYPSRRRKSRRAAANRNHRTRLRLVYFSLASLWGFLIGTVTLLFGFSLSGRRLELSPVAIVSMSVAIIIAVIGGIVASRAYREATHRKR